MRQPSSRRSKTIKHSPCKATPCTDLQWTFVEPTLSPMMTHEQAEVIRPGFPRHLKAMENG